MQNIKSSFWFTFTFFFFGVLRELNGSPIYLFTFSIGLVITLEATKSY